MPHQCKKNLIFLTLFLDSAIAGQPSGWCGTSAGMGQESALHGPGGIVVGTTTLSCLTWLEPRAACVAWATDCGAEAQY